MDGPAAKLVQRKLYSWLSSRRGLPLCLIGFLVLAISAFQFGEVLLEWSKERYSAQFSVYHDNIAGRSFERYMTPELPIDIVYTWVNGSDPILIKKLKRLKQELLLKQNREHSNSTNTSESVTKSTPPGLDSCPFKNCVTWRVLLVDAQNFSSSLTLSAYKKYFPKLIEGEELFYLNSSGDHVTPVYGIRMKSEETVSSFLNHHVLITYDNKNISLTRGYLTSDGTLVGSIPLPSFTLLVSPLLIPGNNTTLNNLKLKLNNYTKNAIAEVEVVSRGVGMARLKNGNWDKIWTGNRTIKLLNGVVTLHNAYAIWMPFSPLNNTTEKIKEHAEIISQNRFQDNEELKYSLRSVEKYAPWIRHIYIVTNGQIPHWLDLDSPRVTIVTHEEIFLNKSHLPSYSSPAIESHIHRIHGLSKWFLYLNDDVMFGQEVWPCDFFTPDGGQKIYLSWSVPNCADGCPPSWILDNYCDTACNTSDCDWDGGDCVNASHPGPVGGYSWSQSQFSDDYCNSGCLTSWLGDRYCDSSCNIFTCGYDAGDCGVEDFDKLYHIAITHNTPLNNTFIIPLETSSMYFNLSSVFPNGSVISSAEHSMSPVIRSAVVAKLYNTLSLTFSRNVTRSSIHFIIKGKYLNESKTIQFIVVADTATRNTSAAALGKNAISNWSFFKYNDTTDMKFLTEVASKFQNNDKNINYWRNERSVESFSPPILSLSLPNYTVTNISLLPSSVASQFINLQNEQKDGDITIRGYLKETAVLLQRYKHIPGINSRLVTLQNKPDYVTKNSTHYVTKNSTQLTSKYSNIKHDSVTPRVELLHEGIGNGPVIKNGMRRLMEKKEVLAQETPESYRWLPWEKLNIFPEASTMNSYDIPNRQGRHLMDTFGDSLKHVDKIYNRAYGHINRKVPAHMPHMINKEIMQELQDKYPEEFDRTSSHHLRSSDDMQYGFSYYYYVIGEKKSMTLHDVFIQLDTDLSGILSVRELRTLLVKMSLLPLSLDDIHEFENMLKDCDHTYKGTSPSVDPREYETHYDPDLPLVTEDFVAHCKELLNKLKDIYGAVNKYKYEEYSEDQVAFKMLHENSSRIVGKLDEVRKDQRKFICLNDNMDHSREESRLAQLLLRDFYESLFPIPSQFELPVNYRNRFLYVEELKEWLTTRWRIQVVLYLLCCILICLSFGSLFYGKIIQWKRKLTKFITSFNRGVRIHKISTV